MYDAITSHPDTLFVVAAGNAAQNNDTTLGGIPCNYKAANLICVAATDNTDALASFSNSGPTSVDMAAPGVDIDLARPQYLPDAFSDDSPSGLGNWTCRAGRGVRRRRTTPPGWSTRPAPITPTAPTGRSGPAPRSTPQIAPTA